MERLCGDVSPLCVWGGSRPHMVMMARIARYHGSNCHIKRESLAYCRRSRFVGRNCCCLYGQLLSFCWVNVVDGVISWGMVLKMGRFPALIRRPWYWNGPVRATRRPLPHWSFLSLFCLSGVSPSRRFPVLFRVYGRLPFVLPVMSSMASYREEWCWK